MAQRVAFLIGNQTFRPDSGLLPLQGPSNDIAALSRLLGDPERGQFEVHNFLDRPNHEVLPQIEQALTHAALNGSASPREIHAKAHCSLPPSRPVSCATL